MDGMTTNDFDTAVVTAVFSEAGLIGWRDATLVSAARDAGLDLARVRLRFPGKTAVLLRLGTMADQAALAAIPATGSPRDRLFDGVMARIDVLQAHRSGVLALMQSLRTDPATTLMLGAATLRSMRWLLDAAGVPTGGLVGQLRIQGMAAAWAYTLRAWEKDDGDDLPGTMAALDRALDRAMQAEASLPGRRQPDEGFVADVPVPSAAMPPTAATPTPVAPTPVAPIPVALVPDPMPVISPDSLVLVPSPPPALDGRDVADGPDGPAVL